MSMVFPRILHPGPGGALVLSLSFEMQLETDSSAVLAQQRGRIGHNAKRGDCSASK